ncbi:hypothetical protein L2E82_18340 [Cichorium intybus]|uniref:Uncharacterized protein n=1 Tax=Cichorium intybus TaxID=13427 RepID=A0ACB9FAP9_CICIN|nr:hypothetical protein L2E82_18340 [Cichorium intybus]
MAEETLGKQRKKKSLKFGGDGEKNGSSQLPVPAIPVPGMRQRSNFLDHSIIQDFEQDTNRLNYFDVRYLDVFGDDNLTRNASDGGGGGIRDRGVAVGPRLEQEIGSDSAVAGGGIRIRRGPVGNSANDGSEALVRRLNQERANGGGRGNATTGAGGGDWTWEVPGGFFANNASDGGEDIDKKLKQLGGTTVAMPVALVVAMVVIMMVMVIVMVVLIYVIVKMED